MVLERRAGAAWATHPGEILKQEFLLPMGVSEYALAKAIKVNPQRINDITKKRTGMSAEMALLIGRYLGTTPEFWMNLQSNYEVAMAQKRVKGKLEKIAPRAAA